ncbi:unnamed protein product [Darwinula stevensoni]|uniref:C-type lectin domain-containing protein n=1 Tax=Darwinula stevensoni TaxID=69355 RepID=A0A7R9ADC1_9CRUS|nr:unnamed protein product [Darwinula stevensoni]CAG0900975.1 unnamed protein product [Darwinula stevensoni]
MRFVLQDGSEEMLIHGAVHLARVAGSLDRRVAGDDAGGKDNSPGWVFRESRYWMPGDSLSWGSAEMLCRKVGGNLVSIHSIDERLFLQKIAKQNTGEFGEQMTWGLRRDVIHVVCSHHPPLLSVWIGARKWDRMRVPPKFVWTDGTEGIYESLADEGVQEHHVGDRCLAMAPSGDWSLLSCFFSLPFLCKAELQ